jgi:hypothetical protein
MMEAHRNDAIATIFRDMNRFSLMHHDEVKARAGALELPTLKSWQYRWTAPPEKGGDEAFDYMLEPYNALRYARENEARAMAYYRSVADTATDAEVRRLATELAAEEAGHVAALDKWIAQTPRPAPAWDADPDPARSAA